MQSSENAWEPLSLFFSPTFFWAAVGEGLNRDLKQSQTLVDIAAATLSQSPSFPPTYHEKQRALSYEEPE